MLEINCTPPVSFKQITAITSLFNMKILVVLLAAATSIVAEPPIEIKNDYLKSLYNHRYAYSPVVYPVARVVHDVIPGVVPAPAFRFSVPFYTGIKSQYHEQDIFGQARYGHVEPGQSHYAVQDAFGNKIGGFSYYNPQGKLVQTSYVADAAGYRVASNDLPVATKDTPEVAAAKAAHLHEIAKIKSRFRRDAPNFNSFQQSNYRFNQPPFPHAYPTTNLQPAVTNEGFIEETPEVLAAKADHFAKVAASRAHIASLERNRPVEHNFAPVSNPTYDYRYNQQNYQNFNTGVQETPEVLAAKAKHFAELAANKARNSGLVQPIDQYRKPIVPTIPNPVPNPHSFQTQNSFQPNNFQQTNSFQPTNTFQQQDYRYVKPTPHAYPTTNLAPVVTSDGFLEETPEVLAAKANHFSQLAAAQRRALT